MEADRYPTPGAALEGLIVSCEVRLIYLDRTLEATREASAVIARP